MKPLSHHCWVGESLLSNFIICIDYLSKNAFTESRVVKDRPSLKWSWHFSLRRNLNDIEIQEYSAVTALLDSFAFQEQMMTELEDGFLWQVLLQAIIFLVGGRQFYSSIWDGLEG